MNDGKIRCPWCGTDPVYVDYHDKEWGVPVRDDRLMFEFLLLEGFQAGLSWITILKKRDNFRRAFDDFDPEKIARYTPAKLEKLLADPGIVRNRLKVHGAVQNAKAYLHLTDKEGSFADYFWSFMDGQPLTNSFSRMEDVPAKTPLSDAISKDLKKRGFTFVGSTIIYAHMQATGMVNDHLTSCFRWQEVQGL